MCSVLNLRSLCVLAGAVDGDTALAMPDDDDGGKRQGDVSNAADEDAIVDEVDDVTLERRCSRKIRSARLPRAPASRFESDRPATITQAGGHPDHRNTYGDRDDAQHQRESGTRAECRPTAPGGNRQRQDVGISSLIVNATLQLLDGDELDLVDDQCQGSDDREESNRSVGCRAAIRASDVPRAACMLVMHSVARGNAINRILPIGSPHTSHSAVDALVEDDRAPFRSAGAARAGWPPGHLGITLETLELHIGRCRCRRRHRGADPAARGRTGRFAFRRVRSPLFSARTPLASAAPSRASHRRVRPASCSACRKVRPLRPMPTRTAVRGPRCSPVELSV